MQISLKLLLYKQKTYSDETHPVVLQYIINRKAKKKVLTRCKLEDWDPVKQRVKSKVPNATKINYFISDQYSEAEILLYDIKSGNRSVNDIFKSNEKMTLSKAFDAEYDRLKKDMKVAACIKILGLKKYVSSLQDIETLAMSNMDIHWFENFVAKLKAKGNNGSTAQKTFKTLRAMVVRYSDKELEPALTSYRVSTVKSIKAKLTTSELIKLENLQLPDGESITAARDLFLLQIYLRGIRVGDLLQAHSSDFNNGRFGYKADKTDKSLSMKVIPQAIAIVDKYRGKHARLFPFFTWQPNEKLSKFDNEYFRLKHKEACTSVVNRYLKIIAGMISLKTPLSSHIARHTFARMAIDKINNPMVTMELLGHSSLAVHQAYLNDIRKEDELNQAADDIFNNH